jgi:hypothetical protein
MAAYVTYRRAPARWLGLTGLALLSLACAACGKLGMGGGGSGDAMSWARSALERNSHLEVVASDSQTNTFTVRVKETGELRIIRADEVVGAPPSVGTSPAGAPATPASAPPPSNELATPSATASTQPADRASPSEAEPPGPAAAAASPRIAPFTAGQSANAVERTGLRTEPAPRAESPNPNSDVAAITPGGRTLESGPGYVIKTASKGATNAGLNREHSTTSSVIERRHDPIVCQGDRLLQIDNRNLEFDGDAVSAEDGCEIHITNSRITAKGIGVSARAANVHIENSQIEGDAASIDASKGAQVYASSSTFRGTSRRLDNSSLHDLGGNVWN